MTTLLSAGILLTFAAIALILYRWGNIRCIGVTPVRTFTFIAILFTSGLDVGLIMFPLTEFAGYADLAASPEYGFSNPLAIEFGFWGFLIWGFYFLTCFYFCVIEPRTGFFELAPVKFINNMVIIGTCAFTAFLLLSNLPWYMPDVGDGSRVVGSFYLIVLLVIAAAVYSSTSLRYVKILSLGTSWLFIALIAVMGGSAFIGTGNALAEFAGTFALLGDYFGNLHRFVLPINDYHEFYLYWWFSWSIMIGQFTARFVGGLRTWQLLAAMLIFPSLAIGTWFSVLYYFHINELSTAGFFNWAMVVVGISMVINSLDSLIRLYTDNLGLSVSRLGKVRYFAGNLVVLAALTLLFRLDFLEIQWVGALVIGLFFACAGYMLLYKRAEVLAIEDSPTSNRMDYRKLEWVN
ncbi:BCCT family transporter [Oceanimonas pelagia]|uniref:BCCT family transporter n=1 Tax=Oceanimonas pelagia TaxID=3028314 RepID=A0AA50KNU2_9GAMM|nr:BCCT family transporter [Oceanimonas pelagia]WMC10407.1 BCCT family transporter [Oceanimonas pelagia]